MNMEIERRKMIGGIMMMIMMMIMTMIMIQKVNMIMTMTMTMAMMIQKMKGTMIFMREVEEEYKIQK